MPKQLACKIIFTFVFRIILITGEVIVDFGHYKEPFVKEEGNVTYLQNSNIVLQIRCTANYPTQWITNQDDGSRNSQNRLTLQWTDRNISGYIDDGIYKYIAWIQLEYSTMIESEIFLCAAINDPNKEDRITVSLTPVANDNTVKITRLAGNTKIDQGLSEDEEATVSACDVQISFQNREGGEYYWRCQGSDGTQGQISFKQCGSAMQCQNAYRNIKKLNNCLKIVDNEDPLDGWTLMKREKFAAGTVICSHKNRERAQSYFFAKPANGFRKIELNWNAIQPSDLVWMDPVEHEYYSNEVLGVVCHFPKFGFSFGPYSALVQDGIRIKFEPSEEDESDKTWVSKINYNLTKPGAYVVQCLAPVWNTTEWVNKTSNFIVKVPIAPNFKENSENITFTEGDVDKSFTCIARGEPKPEITWENVNLPVISVNGAELIFHQVTEYVAGNYVCSATNRFGISAKKTFNLRVQPKPKGSALGPIAIIGILCTCLIAILLIIGFILFYRKFIKLSEQMSNLTYEEIEAFREGNKKNQTVVSEEEENRNNTSVDCLPYNSKYEVARDKICLDEDAILGAGVYGTVMNGTLLIDSEKVPVAFKTVLKHGDVSYFKALLSELKILAYIGEHANVVRLVGAWTQNIRQREILVGVELCKISLLEFLRSSCVFTNCFQNFQNVENLQHQLCSDSTYENVTPKFSTLELLQWSEDIANGMDFLASKKVIHGDLAARNVLLSFDMQAKICDFGLARQLIDYNYIKSQACPLPWKWMAIESLSQMKFSVHSDTWAYGITLWEIFSLGNIPYPGMSWRGDFIEKLEDGLRMSCPVYANDILYQVMMKCWAKNPKERPNFVEIIKVLKAQTQALSFSLEAVCSSKCEFEELL